LSWLVAYFEKYRLSLSFLPAGLSYPQDFFVSRWPSMTFGGDLCPVKDRPAKYDEIDSIHCTCQLHSQHKEQLHLLLEPAPDKPPVHRVRVSEAADHGDLYHEPKLDRIRSKLRAKTIP
jgi:hypothetical protein